ncbi:helix-turn-helix domain-containing protein [Amycolatopsis roodepoortensis]|uniref:Transcriptional regulator with XRE-family HTH domain n=1 Tax=Amycolatopsis roodepoortensis TaxID=700274 RepID=A0ABR9LJI9_9PSEU|nr:helix-turn-helix transcriptional regulator [Amycolatopsis roodepoortensis]MBE1580452.1 transcriptional regulator with XRE-family HTH domain [Amycolatopsis roodepoortensis]
MKTMLQHLRETADLNQRELASRAKVTQETVSQLETGKSARPRLDTLTKLRDALELGDLRPESLLDPSPLDTDPDLTAAEATLITLVKVLPAYRADSARRPEFWWKLSEHLGYSDLYPATHISSHLESAVTGSYSNAATDLAGYVLMFFDPANDGTIKILAKYSGIGPQRQVARRWCQDVTDAAWVLHRAAMTSYPQQVGELYAEAGETTDPARIRELCGSVYAIVRARAYTRASAEDQINALVSDPSTEEVHYKIGKAAGLEVQETAVKFRTAWPGLAVNPDLDPEVAARLLDAVLDRLGDPRATLAGRALLNLAERHDLPRPLLQRISDTIDVDRDQRPEIDGGWVVASVLAIRSTLHDLDHPDDEEEDNDVASRPALRVVTDEEAQPGPWWHRFLNRGR